MSVSVSVSVSVSACVYACMASLSRGTLLTPAHTATHTGDKWLDTQICTFRDGTQYYQVAPLCLSLCVCRLASRVTAFTGAHIMLCVCVCVHVYALAHRCTHTHTHTHQGPAREIYCASAGLNRSFIENAQPGELNHALRNLGLPFAPAPTAQTARRLLGLYLSCGYEGQAS